MRSLQLAGLLALLLAAVPCHVDGQGANAGGLAVAPASAAGSGLGGGASAAAAPLTAAGVAGSITGSSLGQVSTGGIDTSTAGQSVGTVVRPPRTPVNVTVPPVSKAGPKAPSAKGGLATCTFAVKGTGAAAAGSQSSAPNTAPSGTAKITCKGAGAPIDLFSAGAGVAGFTTDLTGVNFEPNTFGGPRPVLQFVNLNIRIEDSSFTDLVGSPYTLIFNNSNVEFVNTVFSGNSGTPEGVIHGFGSFFNFTNCNFTGNVGRQTGVMTVEDGVASFVGSLFAGNRGAQANAGAVVVGRNSIASFTTSTFVNNVGSAGGAVLAYQGTTLSIDRCTFAGNQASNDGGAIQHLGGAITIANSTFSQNTAGSIAGAYFGAEVSGMVADSDFLNNTATNGQGGGVYLTTAVLDVSNTRFASNSGEAGGGLFQDNVQGIVSGCAFENNTATNSGGGISQAGGTGDVEFSIFVNNQAVNLGGGLYQNNRTTSVSSSIFSGNSATQDFAGQGAGLFRSGINGDATNLFFENNTAALNGGGLYAIASIGDFANCTFLANSASTGPAVYAFNCAGRIFNNAFANEPFDAVAIDHSIGFTEKSLITGRVGAPIDGLGSPAAAPAAGAAPGATGLNGLRRLLQEQRPGRKA